MPAFRMILVAADFSEQSKEAFRFACALAGETKTRLVVLHVAEQPIGSGGPGMLIPIPPDTSTYHDSLREKLRTEYIPDRPLDTDHRVRAGGVADEVLHEAQEDGADLIVLGTHGRTGLRRLLAGSVAEAVLRRAHCPVLALRASEIHGPLLETRTILHPTDFSAPAAAALRIARSLARDRGAKLHILHVVPDLVLPAEAMVLPLDDRPMLQALEEIRIRTDGPDLKYPVEVELRRGGASLAILEATEVADCDLIVLGTHGRTGIGRFLMGSVAEYVLRGANCPVLVV